MGVISGYRVKEACVQRYGAKGGKGGARAREGTTSDSMAARKTGTHKTTEKHDVKIRQERNAKAKAAVAAREASALERERSESEQDAEARKRKRQSEHAKRARGPGGIASTSNSPLRNSSE